MIKIYDVEWDLAYNEISDIFFDATEDRQAKFLGLLESRYVELSGADKNDLLFSMLRHQPAKYDEFTFDFLDLPNEINVPVKNESDVTDWVESNFGFYVKDYKITGNKKLV